MERPSWPEYFMSIARLVSVKSTCLRRQNGAIAVVNKRILATGYNGQMPGAPHCEKCLRAELNIPSSQRMELCRALHAEQNLLTQCSKYGVSMNNSEIYTVTKPCSTCFKFLVGAGAHSILYEKDYPDELVDMLIKEAGFISDMREGFLQIRRSDG